MKKQTFKTAFALTLSLFMLVGCGFFARQRQQISRKILMGLSLHAFPAQLENRI